MSSSVRVVRAAIVALLLSAGVGVAPASAEPSVSLLASGLQGAFGSTVGPGGDLYVAEGVARRVSRIDPETGTVTTFASGLPAQVVPGAGAASDVAFVEGRPTCWSSSSAPTWAAPTR